MIPNGLIRTCGINTVCYPFLELVPIRRVKEVNAKLFFKKSSLMQTILKLIISIAIHSTVEKS